MNTNHADAPRGRQAPSKSGGKSRKHRDKRLWGVFAGPGRARWQCPYGPGVPADGPEAKKGGRRTRNQLDFDTGTGAILPRM